MKKRTECDLMIGLSQNRSRHCLEVARLMYEMAVERGWEINRCQEMFILGYVHDIGYEFCSNQQEHSNVGADLLQK